MIMKPSIKTALKIQMKPYLCNMTDKEFAKLYYEASKDKKKAYYIENMERIKAYQKKRYHEKVKKK